MSQLVLVELVRAADVRQHDLAVDPEDQALDDLADVDTDRGSGVGSRLGALREPARFDRQPELGGSGSDTGDVRVDVGHAHNVATGAARRHHAWAKYAIATTMTTSPTLNTLASGHPLGIA